MGGIALLTPLYAYHLPLTLLCPYFPAHSCGALIRLTPYTADTSSSDVSLGNALILVRATRYQLGAPCPKFSGLHYGLDIAVRHARFIFVREELVAKSILSFLSV